MSDIKEKVLKSINGKPLLILAKVENRLCEYKKNKYIVWDEFSKTVKCLPLHMIINMNSKLRNARVNVLSGNRYSIDHEWCSSKRVPVVNMTGDTTYELAKGQQIGVWVLRRYKTDSEDYFDVVNYLGEYKRVTHKELLNMSDNFNRVNVAINSKGSIRGIKAIPIVNITDVATKKENKSNIEANSNRYIKGCKKVAIVLRYSEDATNSTETKVYKFKITATKINMTELSLLIPDDCLEFSNKYEGKESVIVTVKNSNNVSLFNYLECLLSNIAINDLNLNCFVTNTEVGSIKFNTTLSRKLVEETSLINREVYTDGSILYADNNVKVSVHKVINYDYMAIVNMFYCVKSLDKRSVDKIIEEYNKIIGVTDADTIILNNNTNNNNRCTSLEQDVLKLIKKNTIGTGRDLNESEDEAIFKCLRLTKQDFDKLKDFGELAPLLDKEGISFITVKMVATTDNPLIFKHVTLYENADKILEKGLNVNKKYVGDLGVGSYVIGENDYDAENNLKDYLSDAHENELIDYDGEETSPTKFAFITGSYIGVYHLCVHGDGHVGYIVLDENVPANLINKSFTESSVIEYLN